MGLVHTFGTWFKPELDYMTNTEKIFFNRLLRSGELTFFRTATCKNCNCDILKGKKYCSLKCKEESEGEKENEN